MDDWRATLEESLRLEPDHISAYNLTYEEDTAFFESLRRGDMLPDEDRDAEMFHLACEMLESAGYRHYETSNYARPGRESRHNLGYWQGEDYLGLGPSAVSTLSGTRHTNVADTTRYAAMVSSLGRAVVESDPLTTEQRHIADRPRTAHLRRDRPRMAGPRGPRPGATTRHRRHGPDRRWPVHPLRPRQSPGGSGHRRTHLT